MAFTRKSSSPVQRIEGELPDLPDGNELGLDGWWLDTKGVIDRVRDRIDDVAGDLASPNVIKNTLGVVGDVVGTDNEGQEIENKVLGGGSF
jgi:hypothetical protein